MLEYNIEKNLIIEINKSFFLSILSSLSKIATTNKIINKFSLINISLDKKITFSASNDVANINIIVDKNNENITKFQEGEVSVSCKELTEIIYNIPDEKILISLFDGSILEIKGKKSIYRLNVSENSKSQKIIVNNENVFKINNNQLSNLINQISYISLLKDDITRISCINIQGNDNLITATNISKYRMSKKQIKTADKIKNFSVSVSVKAINDIVKIFENKNEEINISISNEKIFFYTRDTIISLVLSNSNFPDIQKMLDKKFNYLLSVKNKKISSELEGICIINNKNVRMEMLENKIIFSMCDNANCSGYREIDSDFKFSGKKFEIEFNGHYVLEVLKILKNSEDVVFQFDDKNKPFLIKNIEGDSLHLIAPIVTC